MSLFYIRINAIVKLSHSRAQSCVNECYICANWRLVDHYLSTMIPDSWPDVPDVQKIFLRFECRGRWLGSFIKTLHPRRSPLIPWPITLVLIIGHNKNATNRKFFADSFQVLKALNNTMRRKKKKNLRYMQSCQTFLFLNKNYILIFMLFNPKFLSENKSNYSEKIILKIRKVWQLLDMK